MPPGFPYADLILEFLRVEITRLRSLGVNVGEDDYRGLHISEAEANRLLSLPGKVSTGVRERLDVLMAGFSDRLRADQGPLRRLSDVFALSTFESACVALCLVAENDLGVERLIAYAQDDISKRRPRVDLALNLFGESLLDSFHASRPLGRFKLLQLLDEPGQPFTPLRARYLALDPGVAAFLLGSEDLSESLFPEAGLLEPKAREEAGAGAAVGFGRRVASLDPSRLQPPIVALTGDDEQIRLECVQEIAAELNRDVIVADFASLALRHGLESALTLVLREGAMRGVAVYLAGIGSLSVEEWQQLRRALEAGCAAPLVILSSGTAQTPWRGLSVTLPPLEFDSRRTLWAASLKAESTLSADDLDLLTETYPLDASSISGAARIAAGFALWRGGPGTPVSASDAFNAARQAASPVLSTLAKRIIPRFDWADLVLTTDTMAQLRELTGRARHTHTVLDTWGFGEKQPNRGLVALFAGPSGTGKTMAAQIIARDLQLDLFAIDLSGVVSKYIGETEKNLEAIFREATATSALLFFDEADAIFGKRSEVKDAHDRYANIETAYLLQRIEAYGGPVVLATNLKQNLDDAFLRRLDFAVDFPAPDVEERKRIWVSSFPPAAPLGADADFELLARQFRLTGGNIRNIARTAAFMAATDGSEISLAVLMAATRREYQKLGRMISEAEFGVYMRSAQEPAR